MKYFIVLWVFVVGIYACAYQQEAKTVDRAAVLLCDMYFAEQNPGLSAVDVEKTLCTTAKDLQPFIGAAKDAALIGGKARAQK
jgi:hypothetical protein